MNEVQRRREYKRIWRKRKRAKKRGDMAAYYDLEDELDELRKYKKDSKAYTQKMKKRAEQRAHNQYYRKGEKGYTNGYYWRNHDKCLKRQRKLYYRCRHDPKRWQAHLATKRAYYRTHKKAIQKSHHKYYMRIKKQS